MSVHFTHHVDVTAGHPCFEGHFPNFPVFPAVGQLSLLTEAISMLHGKQCTITFIPVAKFLHPIKPDTALEIKLQPRDKNSADFSIVSAENVVTKGKVQYRLMES